MPVALKRAYEKPSLSDGQRVLVDRLWPRGIKKEQGKIDHWLRDLAPSDTLRKWFHGNGNWSLFKKRYFKELSTPQASAELEILYKLISEHAKVTLVYASKDAERNNAAPETGYSRNHSSVCRLRNFSRHGKDRSRQRRRSRLQAVISLAGTSTAWRSIEPVRLRTAQENGRNSKPFWPAKRGGRKHCRRGTLSSNWSCGLTCCSSVICSRFISVAAQETT